MNQIPGRLLPGVELETYYDRTDLIMRDESIVARRHLNGQRSSADRVDRASVHHERASVGSGADRRSGRDGETARTGHILSRLH